MVRGIKKAEIVRLLEKLNCIKEDLETITSEMESYYDERSEEWQDGEGGEIYTEKMNDIEFITGYIEEGITILEDWIDG